MIHPIPFSDVSLSSGFWTDRHQVNRNRTLSTVYYQTDKTYRFESLKGNRTLQETRYAPTSSGILTLPSGLKRVPIPCPSIPQPN